MTTSGTYTFARSSVCSEAIVYEAVNKVNGKRYIGVTIRGISVRRKLHLAQARRGGGWRFHAAIRKYGEDSFQWNIISNCDDYHAALLEEKRLVAELRPEYNVAAGGAGCVVPMTIATKQKMIDSRRWYKPSEETKQKTREALTGRKRPEEVCEKIRAARLAHPENNKFWLGKKRDAAMRARLSEKRKKPVRCIDDGILFQSLQDAADHYGMKSHCSISQAIAKSGRAYGRRFQIELAA